VKINQNLIYDYKDSNKESLFFYWNFMAKFNTPITLNNGDESKYFKWLTKAEENQIFSQVDSLPISQYEKNLKADALYKQMLDKKKHTQFVNDRMEATNEIYDKSLDSKDPVEAQTLKSQWKFWQLADMVRNLMYEKEWMNLDNFKDEDVVTAFLKDNPDMVNQFDSFMNWEQTAESFATRNWFDYNQIDKAVDQVFWSNWTTASYMNQQWEWEWNDEFFWRLDTETLDQWASVKWFLKNLAKSTWNVVADVWNMVVNPFDTANALAKTAVWAWMNVLWIDDNTDDEWWLAEANQVADWLWEFLKERYWGKKEILNTLYSDPMWLVSDIASIATWWAWAVKSIAWGIAKGAAKVWLANTARTAWNVSKVAGKVMNIADKADPYTQAMKVYGKWWEKAVEYWTKWVNYVKENFNIDNFVWLDAKTKKNIQDNPYAAEAWEKAQNYIEENWLPDKSQRVSKDLMQWVVEEVQTEINKLKQQLWETSPEYKKLKESWAKVSFYDINNKINEILENAGVQISEKWALDFSKTAIKDTEASAIRRLYNWAKSTDEMDIAEYMRYRKFIDELWLWEDAKGTPWKNVLKQIREAGNEIAHEQVEPLKLLDKQFSERAAALDKVTEWIVYREKRKAGQIKDNINQILKNLDEPNRRMLSQRLQEILPWVEEKVRAINMLPKLIDNYYRHDHAADIMKTMWLSSIWGLIWSAWWGIIWWIAWTVWWYFLGKWFNKLKQSRWEKAMWKLSEAGQQKLSEISEKIQAKEDLSKFEENYVKAIGKQIEEWNFKENQVSSKTATNQEVFNDLADAIADIWEDTTDADIKLIEQLLEENRKELSEWDYKTLKSVLEDQKSDWEIAKWEKEFMEWEWKRIINNEDAKAVKDFQSRILKIENEEKNVWKVAWKKVNKSVADAQQRAVESKREKLIEEIWEYYWLDQYEAANKYDELRDSANVNNVKYQTADEPITKDSAWKTLTKEQQDFFKWSKAVDKDWNLLKLYHWTTAWDFTVFQQWKNGSSNSLANVWYWFTPDEKWAKAFAEQSSRWDAPVRAEEVYLDIKNPKIYEPSEINLLDPEAKKQKIDEQWDIYKKKDSEANWKDYTRAGGFFHDEYDHPYYERQIFQNLKRKYEYDVQYEWKFWKYDPEEFRWLAEEWNRNRDANLDYDKIVKDFEDYQKTRNEAQAEYDKYLDMEKSDPYENFQYDIYKVDSNLDRKWTKKDLDMALNDYKSPTKYVEQLKAQWYDWIIIKWTEYDWNVFWWRNDQYVVFDSNQIKRTSNLNPTKNEDIRFQKYWTAWEWEKWVNAIQWLNIRNFKNWKSVKELADNYWIKTHIVQSISTPEWQKAYGMYWDRVITLAKDLKESTVPHELLHATFDMVDQWKKNQILDGIKNRLKVDDVQAEEWLADNFSEYYRTGKFDTKAIPTTFVWQIKQFFQQIKEYIDWTYANRKEIQNLFDDIIDGKLEWEYWVYSDPKFQTVWHGSPAAFEKFDSSHMWEWEWAQAHGWGHYVAVEERTWRHYAELNSKMWYAQYKWEPLNDMYRSVNLRSPDWEEKSLAVDILTAHKDYNLTIPEAIKKSKEYYENEIKKYEDFLKDEWLSDMHKTYKSLIEKYKKKIDIIDGMKEKDFTRTDRNIYNLEIPDPIKKDTPTGSNYIEENGKLTLEQRKDLIKRLREINKDDEHYQLGVNYLENKLYASQFKWDDTRKDVYRYFSDGLLDRPKEASKALESIWYDWIHYFWWRDWEAYVIFNDDALKINSHEQY